MAKEITKRDMAMMLRPEKIDDRDRTGALWYTQNIINNWYDKSDKKYDGFVPIFRSSPTDMKSFAKPFMMTFKLSYLDGTILRYDVREPVCMSIPYAVVYYGIGFLLNEKDNPYDVKIKEESKNRFVLKFTPRTIDRHLMKLTIRCFAPNTLMNVCEAISAITIYASCVLNEYYAAKEDYLKSLPDSQEKTRKMMKFVRSKRMVYDGCEVYQHRCKEVMKVVLRDYNYGKRD